MKTSKFLIIGIALILTACANKDAQFDASGVFEVTELMVSAQANGELMTFNVMEGQTVDTKQYKFCFDATGNVSFQRKYGYFKKTARNRQISR